MGKNMNKEDIVKEYERVGTIRDTSINLGVSEQKVRKILLESGSIRHELYDKIIVMYDAGKSANEIAGELKISRSTVYSYLPYIRKSYKMDDRTNNAIKIKKWREKKKLSND